MILAILQFDLLIPTGPHASLKDKRRVVKSIKDRLHREHMVSVAEVAHQDTLNLARLALVFVGSDGRRAGEILDSITSKLRSLAGHAGAQLGDTSRQIIHASQLEGLAEADSGDTGEAGQVDEDLAREMLRRFDEPGDVGTGDGAANGG